MRAQLCLKPLKSSKKCSPKTPASIERKLSFSDQCAAFYALFRGFKPDLVAKVFGTTPTASRRSSTAMPNDPRRYRHVKDEFYNARP